MLENPDFPNTGESKRLDRNILLSHESDAAPADWDYDLALNGHSHGGPMDLPFPLFINERTIAATDFPDQYQKG